MKEQRRIPMSKKWLLENAPGFNNLASDETEELFNFVFLWSLFEEQVMDKRATAHSIFKKIEDWDEAGRIDFQHYHRYLEYYRDRYYFGGEFTDRFGYLNFQNNDALDTIKSVIAGVNNTPRDCLYSLVMIVFRLRNNFFHGEKWQYKLKEQFSNFERANNILMQLIEDYGTLTNN